MLIVPVADVWNDNYPLLEAKLHKFRAARQSPGDIPLASYVFHSSYAPAPESRPSRSGYFSLDS